MSIKSLESLEAWRKSKEFSLRVYREALPLLPPEEKWNLDQQLLFDSLEQDGEKLTQLINGYINYLKRSKQGQNEPGANYAVREDIVMYDINAPESSPDDTQFPTPE